MGKYKELGARLAHTSSPAYSPLRPLQLVKASMWQASNNWMRMGVMELCCCFLIIKGNKYHGLIEFLEHIQSLYGYSYLMLVAAASVLLHIDPPPTHPHDKISQRERATRSVECLNIMIVMSHISFWKERRNSRTEKREREIIRFWMPSKLPPASLHYFLHSWQL